MGDKLFNVLVLEKGRGSGAGQSVVKCGKIKRGPSDALPVKESENTKYIT